MRRLIITRVKPPSILCSMIFKMDDRVVNSVSNACTDRLPLLTVVTSFVLPEMIKIEKSFSCVKKVFCRIQKACNIVKVWVLVFYKILILVCHLINKRRIYFSWFGNSIW